MLRCPACSREIVDDSVLCSYCGTAVQTRPAATVTTGPQNAPTLRDADLVTSSGSIDDARFTPGTLLAGRYRIVGRLGRGGMGEVYRADDLKLRQAVALKFLPVALTRDSRRLQRLHEEVRVARQVSHPNVCRMYDIAEAEGQHFLSMEFIDGHDLATVLRRMGRPARDKALEIARQLCAGLAAAHDRGVLHRDLKPHNVMIDENGKVRIADFGLAGFVDDFVATGAGGGGAFAGTPPYMAPEQSTGGRVSVRSDIYSLGLVLFELFTGQRALAGTTHEDIEHSRSALPSSLSSFAEDVDPAVERVILRCLEPEPAARPASALAVAAALPGGDPLAAALAAGETPAPALVAAAGGTGSLRPAVAILCLAVVVAGMLGSVALRKPLLELVPLEKPPEVLAERAAEILTALGHTVHEHQAFGFQNDYDYIRYIEDHDKSATRWEALGDLRPPAIYFWFRHSPRPLLPAKSSDHVALDDPPSNVSGMGTVLLDPRGRLVSLQVEPPQVDESTADAASLPVTDWGLLFSDAGLEEDTFQSVPSTWTPPSYCDERAAWVGHYPEKPDVEIRVETGAYRGRPTYFAQLGPWSRPTRIQPWQPRPGWKLLVLVQLGILAGVILASLVIARRNLRLRRGDRSGANRLAVVLFVIVLASWMLVITHVAEPAEEFDRITFQVGLDLVLSASVWLLYIALEPYVRRRWPQTLIAWNRLLSGGFRDPLVGRDILCGAVAAAAVVLVWSCEKLVILLLGFPPGQPSWGDAHTLLGGRYVLGALLDPTGVWVAFFILFLLFVLRVLLRRQWLAVLALLVLFIAPEALTPLAGESLAARVVNVGSGALSISILITLLLRFGLLSLIAMFVVSNWASLLPVTLNFSAWYAGGGMIALGAVAALSIYAAHTALAGQPLLRDELLEG